MRGRGQQAETRLRNAGRTDRAIDRNHRDLSRSDTTDQFASTPPVTFTGRAKRVADTKALQGFCKQASVQAGAEQDDETPPLQGADRKRTRQNLNHRAMEDGDEGTIGAEDLFEVAGHDAPTCLQPTA